MTTGTEVLVLQRTSSASRLSQSAPASLMRSSGEPSRDCAFGRVAAWLVDNTPSDAMGGLSLFARRFAVRFENRVDKAVLRSRLGVPASMVSCASPNSAFTPTPRTIRWILGSAIL